MFVICNRFMEVTFWIVLHMSCLDTRIGKGYKTHNLLDILFEYPTIRLTH